MKNHGTRARPSHLPGIPARGAVLAALLAVLTSCGRAQLDVPSNAVRPDGMLGAWSVDYRGGDGLSYAGTLDVSKSTGEGGYRGNLRLEFTDRAGEYTIVEEDADIGVLGNRVEVLCRKPVVITENSEYVPDNFYLTRQGDVMTGYERDNLHIGGTVTMTRK